MKAVFAELAAGIEIDKTVLYVDEQG